VDECKPLVDGAGGGDAGPRAPDVRRHQGRPVQVDTINIEATLCFSLPHVNGCTTTLKSEEQTGALAPSLDTGCTIRTADNPVLKASPVSVLEATI